MAICFLDVRKRILDRINEEFVENRPTFKRESEDVFSITNSGKAQNRQQAYQIGQNLISRAKELFGGGVDGYVSEYSDYEPLKVNFTISEKLIDTYLQEASSLGEDESFFKGKGIDEFGDSVLLQKEGISQSKASPSTIKKVKQWLNNSGVKIQDIDTQRFGGVNGVALTLEKIVQVAEGKESEALTEEAMHMLTAMIKQGNKTLFGKMMNRIGRYQLYNDTINLYKEDPSYMNEDGTPNIPKIKEETIGKVLAEYYLQNEEENNGELLAQTKSWWQQIIDWIKSKLHINSNPFIQSIKDMNKYSATSDATKVKELALRIQSKVRGVLKDGIDQSINQEDYSSVVTFIGNQLSDFESYDATVDALQRDRDLAEEILEIIGEFKQIPSELKTKLDAKLRQFNVVKHEDNNDPDDENNSSYYTATIDGDTVITDRTTEWAKRRVKQTSGGKDFFTDPEKKKYYAYMAMAGTEGHYDIERIISAALDKNSTLKREDVNIDFKSSTITPVFNKLVKFFLGDENTQGFLEQFPEGSKFHTEQKVFDEKAKTRAKDKNGKIKDLKGRAGTIDLIVELPDGSLKIYDWKFMGFLLQKPDQNFLKRKQHEFQLGDYVRILKEGYGLKSTKIDAFTVPIHAEYQNIEDRDTKEKIPVLKSVTLGNVKLEDEERTSLIPTTPTDQSSGNTEVDALIKKLRGRYTKLYNKKVSEEEIPVKREELNSLSTSIRNLQVGINFKPLAIHAKNFHKNLEDSIKKYKNTDFKALSMKERENIVENLNELSVLSEYYTNLDSIYTSEYSRINLSEESQKTLDELTKISSSARESSKEINKLLDKVAEVIAEEEGFDNLLSPSVSISGIINSMLDSANIPNKVVQLITKLNLKKSSEAAIAANKKIEEFNEKYLALQKLAKSRNVSPISLIKEEGSHKLFRKYKKDRFDAKNKAIESGDMNWIKKNINISEYDKLFKPALERKIKYVEERIYSNEEKDNKRIRDVEILKAKQSLDIHRPDFNGWDDTLFKIFVNETLIKNGWETDRYLESLRPENTPILDVYNWIEEFNGFLKKDLGYLPKEASNGFLPFIKATTLQRLANSNNTIATIKNIVGDAFTVQANEEQSYGKIDDETGEQRRDVPIFFTRDQKENSEDLLKIMNIIINTAYKYKAATEVEETFNLLQKVEANKDHLEIDRRTNGVIFEGDKPRIFEGNEKSADFVQKLIDDYVYGISMENDTAIDNLIHSKTSGTEGEKEQRALKVKKTILQGNMWTQQLAVGLKALVAIPNFFGGNMQAVINSGRYGTKGEFLKNEGRIVSSSLSKTEKALLNMIVPINEDISKENTRKTAWKEGIGKWIGTWNFNDVMMSTNALPDKLLQLSNAVTWLQNTMLDENGNLVNIVQYVNNKYKGRYNLPESERKDVEKKIQQEIKQLKAEKSLPKVAKFEGDEFSIPGLNESSLALYRAQILEYGRYITGQMSRDNRADYSRNIIARSFMMFKNWIPKQVSVRALDIQKNPILGNWEYGRVRLFAKTLWHLGFKRISKLKDIITGSEEGLNIMREILEDKKREYYKKTGQELTISEEEFFDLVRREIKNEVKELSLLITILGMVLAAKLAAPDDDEDDIRKNRYKFWARATNKVSDELLFYYNPLSMESITRGTVLPSLGLLTKSYNLLNHSMTEIFAIDFKKKELFSDEVKEKNHTLKYLFNMVPIASQFQSELLPIIFPEEAKELGIRTTVESRILQ